MNTSNQITNDSLEIAELLGNRHDKLTQSLDALLNVALLQPPMGKLLIINHLAETTKQKFICFQESKASVIPLSLLLKTRQNLQLK